MPKQIVSSANAAIVGVTPGQAASPLAQAIRFGRMLFISGQGAVDPATGQVVEGDIAVQTRLALDNMTSLLTAAGGSLGNVVNLRVTLRDAADLPGFSDAVGRYFGEQKVTWTCFGGTPNRAGINVQVECIAIFE